MPRSAGAQLAGALRQEQRCCACSGVSSSVIVDGVRHRRRRSAGDRRSRCPSAVPPSASDASRARRSRSFCATAATWTFARGSVLRDAPACPFAQHDPDDVDVVARQDQAAGRQHLRRLDRASRACPSARRSASASAVGRLPCRRPTLLTTCWFASIGNLVTLPTTSSTLAKAPPTTRVRRDALHLEHVGRDRRALLDRRLRDDDLLVAGRRPSLADSSCRSAAITA